MSAKVSDEDYDGLSKRKWCVAKMNGRIAYAVRSPSKLSGKKGNIYMHREIMGESANGLVVDHINGDGLDNRRENLRVCTHQENFQNSHKHRSGRSVGVYYNKAHKKWRAQKWLSRGELVCIGSYDSESEAAAAYQEFIKKL